MAQKEANNKVMKDISRTLYRDAPQIIVTILVTISLFAAAYQTDLQQRHDKETIEFKTRHAVILEDVINDIYERDREYFDKNIATSAPFDSLRSLYKDEFKRDPKQITWEDMYNH